jgi:hypothetical protein
MKEHAMTAIGLAAAREFSLMLIALIAIAGAPTVIAPAVMAADVAAGPAGAAEKWWMIQNTTSGPRCVPPLRGEGIVLTPDEVLRLYPECSRTPSPHGSGSVLIICGKERHYIFTRSRDACEAIAGTTQ